MYEAGTGSFAAASMGSPVSMIKTSQGYAAPFCADFDGDGDVDCIVGFDSGAAETGVQYWENSCAKRYCTKKVAANITLPGSFSRADSNNFFGAAFNASIRYPKPFCIDMDEDGDLDCLIGAMDGNVHFLRNDGSASTPSWTSVSANYFGSDVGSYASPWCGFDYSGGVADDAYEAGFALGDESEDIKCLVGNEVGYVQLFLRSNRVSGAPSFAPSPVPSMAPTAPPSLAPSALPSALPTAFPTLRPTLAPSGKPTLVPTLVPTIEPTGVPSILPSTAPTLHPTQGPTHLPTSAPSAEPTALPTLQPTLHPPLVPTALPPLQPTLQPTLVPSSSPSSGGGTGSSSSSSSASTKKRKAAKAGA